MIREALLFAPLLAGGCMRDLASLLPQPADGFEPTLDLGELAVLDTLPTLEPEGDADSLPDWCGGSDDEGLQRCAYAQVTVSEQGIQGGATFRFQATGGFMCVLVDPEAVHWNPSIAEGGDPEYAWPDDLLDDGDLDVQVGPSQYYNGSPGLDVGDFVAEATTGGRYDYDLCRSSNVYGAPGVHAGPGTIEACEIDTEGREGEELIAALQTFTVPRDDDVLSFAAAVLSSSCRTLESECTLTGEALEPDPDILQTRSGFPELEEAACGGQLAELCCTQPELCGPPPEDTSWCATYTDTGAR